MDNLSNEIPFGYTANQKITVDQISVDKVVIKSPVISDDLGNKIKKYTVMFSQYPLSQILETTSLLAQSKEKTFDFATVGTDYHPIKSKIISMLSARASPSGVSHPIPKQKLSNQQFQSN